MERVSISSRASEMISNGYQYGQIPQGATWDGLMAAGPYSDIYAAAEVLTTEFPLSFEFAMEHLKIAFEAYEEE